jgi:hypothetical protein
MKYNIIIEYFDEQYRVSTDDDITLKQLRDELVISGLDAESSKIYFNGKLLIGCDNLSQYGIKNNDKLVIITIKKNNVKSFVEFVKVKTDVEKKEEKKEEPEKYKAKILKVARVRQPTPDSDSDELVELVEVKEDDEEEIDKIEREEKKTVRHVPIPVKDDSDEEEIVFTQEQEDDLSKVMAFCDVELDEAKKTYLLCRKNLDFTVNTLLDKKMKK